MSFASDSKRFVFVHVHRTGGTSVRQVLREHLPDLRQIGNGHVPHRLLPEPEHGYYSVGVVREPVDWLASLYRYVGWNQVGHMDEATVARQSFSEFIRWVSETALRRGDGVWMRQSEFLAGVQTVIPFERLQQGIARELARLGVSGVVLPRKLATVGVRDAVVGDDDADYIDRHFADDLEVYLKALEDWKA